MLGRCQPASVSTDGRERLAQSGGKTERPSNPTIDASGMSRGGLKQPPRPTPRAQARTNVRRRVDFMAGRSINIAGRADETRLSGLRRCAAGVMVEAVLNVVARRAGRLERRAHLRPVVRLAQV